MESIARDALLACLDRENEKSRIVRQASNRIRKEPVEEVAPKPLEACIRACSTAAEHQRVEGRFSFRERELAAPACTLHAMAANEAKDGGVADRRPPRDKPSSLFGISR